MSYYDFEYEEDRLGMTVTSGYVKLNKDAQNLVGISIGGGAPYCPCLYVVQIFDGTPAAMDGSIEAGDELTAVNGISVKGKTKVEAAKLIQSFQNVVTINFNKLHVGPKQGKSLDIMLKKVKHRIVETMDATTADVLGISRAILVNDALVKKLDELNKMSRAFAQMLTHARAVLRATFQLARVYGGLGAVFSEIGVKEPMARTSEAFTQFGATHRSMEEYAISMLKNAKPILADMQTFLRKAVPDTKLTIRKYLDVKFEYLVKEMDDEEYACIAIHEPLYRVETGNYEYRLVLRCRQDARDRFAKMRSDVLVKIELLDNKHVQDTVLHLKRFIDTIATYHDQCYGVMKQAQIFPLEIDLSQDAFVYNTGIYTTGLDEDDDDSHVIEEGQDAGDTLGRVQPERPSSHSDDASLIDLGPLSVNSAPNATSGSSILNDVPVLKLLDLE